MTGTSLEERLTQAAAAWFEADTDEDYHRHRLAFFAVCRALADKARGRAVSRGLKAAAARGRPIGRPPKVTAASVRRLLAALGKPSLVAKRLGVHRATVHRHLVK